MINLDSVLGSDQRDLKTWNPVVVIRHGFNSSAKPFQSLEQYIKQEVPNATTDNNTYPWRDSVLVNGARLAHHICNSYSSDRPVVFIGHSMGGLVCRIANVILRDHRFGGLVENLGLPLGYAPGEIQEITNFSFSSRHLRNVACAITLATPNSGALLHGQVSGIAALVQTALNAFPSTRVSSVADLTTDRLFRLLQHFKSDTRVMSISGSRWSRFAVASGQLTASMRTGGIQLDMPHDSIVEDRSVDLRSAILPNEVVQNGRAAYIHVRAYENCTDVTHTNIYDDHIARAYILRCIGTY